MSDSSRISAAFVSEQATRFLGEPLTEADAAAVAGFLGSLLGDMRACREYAVADDEPATVYHATENREPSPSAGKNP